MDRDNDDISDTIHALDPMAMDNDDILDSVHALDPMAMQVVDDGQQISTSFKHLRYFMLYYK